MFDVSEKLRLVRDFMVRDGFDMWFVGGCVRDYLYGHHPKDIDLCTSATPEEQIKVYKSAGLKYIETGLKHGTITVVIDDVSYEITSLRTESEHDGRHAKVCYTRDLLEDLGRRDLTINSMALSFDGELIDPFGGEEDLENGVVRFVGDPDERIKEDYLRILRFFRFYARYGSTSIDRATKVAIRASASKLANISVERIWSEISKILTGPSSSRILGIMTELGVLHAIEFPLYWLPTITTAKERYVSHPASIMGYYLASSTAVNDLADKWKWSNEDRARAVFIASNIHHNYKRYDFKDMLVDGYPVDWVIDLNKLTRSHDIEWINHWAIPTMPVNGTDLIEIGFKPGKTLGNELSRLKSIWSQSDYSATKEFLLEEAKRALR